MIYYQVYDLFPITLICSPLQSFVGHGDSINEIRTQPLKPSLIVSASKVRFWTISLDSLQIALINGVQYPGRICSFMECSYRYMHFGICWCRWSSKWGLKCGKDRLNICFFLQLFPLPTQPSNGMLKWTFLHSSLGWVWNQVFKLYWRYICLGFPSIGYLSHC